MKTLTKMTWVEMKLFAREPLTVVVTFALPLIMLYILGGVFGNNPDPDFYRGVGAMDYYVPGYIGLVIASISLTGLPVHLAEYRERGVLRRFRASSLPAWRLFGSQVIVAFVIAMLGSLLLTTVAFLTNDVHTPESVIGVAAAFVISALSFTALGVLLGMLFPTVRAAQGAGLLLWFVMLIIAGAGPPPEVLPDTMRRIGDLMPLRHVITLLQDPWLGLGWNVNEMLVVTGILVVSVLLAIRFFRWE
jgi:ABC-2 type transport system permease protein